MTLIHTIILSLVEGFTEFIPVSSTGHLLITQHLLNIDVPFSFDLFIQLGSYLAALIFFRKQIFEIVESVLKWISRKTISEKDNANLALAKIIVIATIPTGIIYFALGNVIDEHLRTLTFIGLALILFSLVMAYADSKSKLLKTKNYKLITDLSLFQSIKLGLWQSIAMIPGISRSGATISGGIFEGMDKTSATTLSFLIGMPVIILAGLKGLLDLASDSAFTKNDVPNLAVGFVISFIAGYISIKLLINLVSKYGFKYFIYYRILMGLAILLLVAFKI